MALNKSILSSSLYNAFINMNEMGKNNISSVEGNTYAANQIASALSTYLSMAQISSAPLSDIGTYGSGYVYTGTSTGLGIVINVATLTSTLASHFMSDNLTDDKIADYIADDINTTLAEATINVTSSGTYIVPGSPPETLPGSDNGVGMFTGIPTILSTKLKQTFIKMFERAKNADETYDGNRDFANNLAECIDNYIKQQGCLILTYTGPFLICTSNGIIS